MQGSRPLYRSSSGDRWFLVREGDHVFVRHMPNAASGGNPSNVELKTFLSQGQGPEQQELLRLIGTLAENQAERPPAATGSSR